MIWVGIHNIIIKTFTDIIYTPSRLIFQERWLQFSRVVPRKQIYTYT